MSNFAKQFASTIRFWCQEFKLRSKENDELDRISDITFQEGYGGHNTMAGFGYYKEMQRNRAVRKRPIKSNLQRYSRDSAHWRNTSVHTPMSNTSVHTPISKR